MIVTKDFRGSFELNGKSQLLLKKGEAVFINHNETM
jgi:hypothetical protein